jgi:hypothetical protein
MISSKDISHLIYFVVAIFIYMIVFQQKIYLLIYTCICFQQWTYHNKKSSKKIKTYLDSCISLTILLIYFTFQQFHYQDDHWYNGSIMMQDMQGDVVKCDRSLLSSFCHTIQCSGVLLSCFISEKILPTCTFRICSFPSMDMFWEGFVQM